MRAFPVVVASVWIVVSADGQYVDGLRTHRKTGPSGVSCVILCRKATKFF
jgi:hypothetical protein